jgi:hypothetical protein
VVSLKDKAMAEQKSYTELIDAEHLRAHLGPPHPMRSPAKYRSRGDQADRELDKKFHGKQIARGTRLIVRELHPGRRNDVLGYMLGTVVDGEDVERVPFGVELERHLLALPVGVLGEFLDADGGVGVVFVPQVRDGPVRVDVVDGPDELGLALFLRCLGRLGVGPFDARGDQQSGGE